MKFTVHPIFSIFTLPCFNFFFLFPVLLVLYNKHKLHFANCFPLKVVLSLCSNSDTWAPVLFKPCDMKVAITVRKLGGTSNLLKETSINIYRIIIAGNSHLIWIWWSSVLKVPIQMGNKLWSILNLQMKWKDPVKSLTEVLIPMESKIWSKHRILLIMVSLSL